MCAESFANHGSCLQIDMLPGFLQDIQMDHMKVLKSGSLLETLDIYRYIMILYIYVYDLIIYILTYIQICMYPRLRISALTKNAKQKRCVKKTMP